MTAVALSQRKGYAATLLPVRTVGVQGDGRTYSYVAAITCQEKPDWAVLMALARMIPSVCHRVNRIVYVWGDVAAGPITHITPTHLEKDVLLLLKKVF